MYEWNTKKVLEIPSAKATEEPWSSWTGQNSIFPFFTIVSIIVNCTIPWLIFEHFAPWQPNFCILKFKSSPIRFSWEHPKFQTWKFSHFTQLWNFSYLSSPWVVYRVYKLEIWVYKFFFILLSYFGIWYVVNLICGKRFLDTCLIICIIYNDNMKIFAASYVWN